MGYMNKTKENFYSRDLLEVAEGPPGPPGPSGPPGAGFTLSATGNFDLQSKKLENVSAATSSSDAVVKKSSFCC